MFPMPAGVVEGTDIVCGYLTVPEEHKIPNGPTIQLAVAIIKSQAANPKADPLFIAQGGPGGSTIDTYVEALFTTDNGLRTDRDLVLFDQRGTLYSKPLLYCTEIDELNSKYIEKVISREESERLNLEAMTACRERLDREGVNLSAFDSLENAADIDTLRKALGYNKINLYGVSYGTLLALHYMRNFPDSLRSVILDGVVPPQTNFILGSGKTMDQAFTRLFQTCQQDEACNREYPDLEKVFLQVVDQLNDSPARVSITDPETNTVYRQAAIDGDTFLTGIFQLIYVADLIPLMPRMIYDARDGNFDGFARIMAILVFDRSMSYGMYYSVVCAEDANFTPADHDLKGVRPIIAEIEQRTPQALLDLCKIWNVEPLDSTVDQPVKSDIPTLVLSGGFDPITPPEYAADAASTLSHNFSFTFPTGGHGQMLSSDCADQMIQSFLDDPTQAPDSACIDPGATPDFLTSAKVVDMPMVLKLLNLDPVSVLGFLIVCLSLLFLWSSVLVFPLAWLIERSTRQAAPESLLTAEQLALQQEVSLSPTTTPQPRRPSLLLRLSSWLPVTASAVLSLFWLAFIVILVIMITKNDSRLFYGLSGEARPWFILVLIFILATVLMIISAILGWVQRYGPIWRRLYYTLLTLAALTITIVLVAWGMASAIF
jgi:pimeloyl-ACP methyl ester carboxylesterase